MVFLFFVLTFQTVVGNWSLLLGSSGLSGPHGAGLQVHATLDRRHQVWINGTLGGRCLRTAAGYMNGKQRITANWVQKTKKSKYELVCGCVPGWACVYVCVLQVQASVRTSVQQCVQEWTTALRPRCREENAAERLRLWEAGHWKRPIRGWWCQPAAAWRG